MRLTQRMVLPVATLGMLLMALAQPARAQAPEVMLPEQSAAKAKAILQEAIRALGGPAYLAVKDADCTARLSLFGHSGDLTGYVFIRDLWKYPDKNRTEYSKKRNIIDIYNGSQGWTLDKGGVQEASAASIDDFREQLKTDINSLLRDRLNEEGMIFRYSGSDIVDLKPVDWVEMVDRERRTFRMAIDRATRLPLRLIVISRDPAARERTEEANYYSNYHPEDGVQTPFQVTRERNGLKVYQVFYSGCQYNTSLPDELFTRAALEQRWAELPKKK